MQWRWCRRRLVTKPETTSCNAQWGHQSGFDIQSLYLTACRRNIFYSTFSSDSPREKAVPARPHTPEAYGSQPGSPWSLRQGGSRWASVALGSPRRGAFVEETERGGAVDAAAQKAQLDHRYDTEVTMMVVMVVGGLRWT